MNKENIDILVIAYYFNVEKSSTGQILRRFFPNLPKDTFNSTIISVKNDQQYTLPSNVNVINVKESRLGIYLEKVLRNLGLNDLMMTPDYFRYSWGIGAHSVAKKLCAKHSYKYVHTISFPSSSHLIGYNLKKKYNIPWVAQFYDPWHTNPFRPISSSFFRKIDKKHESLVANEADLIILPCHELVEDWKARYGNKIESKILELPFIASQHSEPLNVIRHSKVVISQIGSSNSKRHSDTFIRAICELNNSIPNLNEKLQVNYVGYVTQHEIDLIKELKVDNVVNIVGQLSEKECAFYFENSDIFLAVDANLERNFFFPSKLLKYFEYQKPILGLTTPNSVLEKELSSSNNFFFHIDNIDGVKSFIEKAINNYESICTNDKKYRDIFSADNVLSIYQGKVKEVIAKRND